MIGHYLKLLREGQGLSLRGAAEQVGMTHQALDGLERCAWEPGDPQILDLAKLYGVEPGEIYAQGGRLRPMARVALQAQPDLWRRIEKLLGLGAPPRPRSQRAGNG